MIRYILQIPTQAFTAHVVELRRVVCRVRYSGWHCDHRPLRSLPRTLNMHSHVMTRTYRHLFWVVPRFSTSRRSTSRNRSLATSCKICARPRSSIAAPEDRQSLDRWVTATRPTVDASGPRSPKGNVDGDGAGLRVPGLGKRGREQSLADTAAREAAWAPLKKRLRQAPHAPPVVVTNLRVAGDNGKAADDVRHGGTDGDRDVFAEYCADMQRVCPWTTYLLYP